MLQLSQNQIFAEMNKQNFKIFDLNHDYDLTIIGLRNMPGVENTFDDYITISYKLNNIWQFHSFPCTTNPGLYYLKYPERVDGTAVMCPGQFRGCWKLGLHKGQYEALVQVKSGIFNVWRDKDKDKDGVTDYSGKIYTNAEGINCHHAGISSVTVDKWSAGCIVFKRIADFYFLMHLAYEQVAAGHGETFSFALLDMPF